MRVEPPTITTPCTSSALILASRSTRRTEASDLSISGLASSFKRSRAMLTDSMPPDKAHDRCALPSVESFSFTRRAATSTARLSCGVMACMRASASAASANAWSMSSPPRAESPPVATTSNTPWLRRSSEMSKVPPPKS